ncbi:helix-turn-helix domain-containing protein [Ruixingdingia sedimenti]|uniref:Helix-turn-helix transcriptional regulator n=1 Tax=Ruixingdingia sedimenti TaxID=3073604 RepID=A0ABU1F903_9RHOB|nr:helix-turn-helix transcriptional regulator [Xinfangfangia sp. LG-4]MDR5653356.1 helix-turn-helix transcriptional regulator [Xinfangfangia sp. LG-4]
MTGPARTPPPAAPLPARFRKADLARLGRHLADQRQAAGLTLRALSDRSGISIGAIRALESGQSNPSLGTVVAVVEALGVSLDRMVAAAGAERPRVAVVTRAGAAEDLTDGLADAALSARLLALPPGPAHPAPEPAARHPSFAMVIAGRVLAATAAGDAPAALGPGDSYHAQPGQVLALAHDGGGPARLLHVTDIRRDGQPDAP